MLICLFFSFFVFSFFFFFFNDTATTEIYTLSLHDALPISKCLPWKSSLARRFSFSAIALRIMGRLRHQRGNLVALAQHKVNATSLRQARHSQPRTLTNAG